MRVKILITLIWFGQWVQRTRRVIVSNHQIVSSSQLIKSYRQLHVVVSSGWIVKSLCRIVGRNDTAQWLDHTTPRSDDTTRWLSDSTCRHDGTTGWLDILILIPIWLHSIRFQTHMMNSWENISRLVCIATGYKFGY